MTKDIAIADEVPFLGADWFDPLEAGIRQHIRGFIENLLEEELAATLRRDRYDRSTAAAGQWAVPTAAPLHHLLDIFSVLRKASCRAA